MYFQTPQYGGRSSAGQRSASLSKTDCSEDEITRESPQVAKLPRNVDGLSPPRKESEIHMLIVALREIALLRTRLREHR